MVNFEASAAGWRCSARHVEVGDVLITFRGDTLAVIEYKNGICRINV